MYRYVTKKNGIPVEMMRYISECLRYRSSAIPRAFSPSLFLRDTRSLLSAPSPPPSSSLSIKKYPSNLGRRGSKVSRYAEQNGRGCPQAEEGVRPGIYAQVVFRRLFKPLTRCTREGEPTRQNDWNERQRLARK